MCTALTEMLATWHASQIATVKYHRVRGKTKDFTLSRKRPKCNFLRDSCFMHCQSKNICGSNSVAPYLSVEEEERFVSKSYTRAEKAFVEFCHIYNAHFDRVLFHHPLGAGLEDAS